MKATKINRKILLLLAVALTGAAVLLVSCMVSEFDIQYEYDNCSLIPVKGNYLPLKAANGSKVSFYVEPEDGYTVDAVYVNFGTLIPVGNVYSFTLVKNTTVSVTTHSSSAAQKTLTNIRVTSVPTKTIYNEGEKFDPAGMQITAYFSDGSSDIVSNYVYDDGPLTANIGEITVKYTYDGTTYEVKVAINVNVQPKTLYTAINSDGRAYVSNSDGKEIVLKGTNAGGWLVMESWQNQVEANGNYSDYAFFTELNRRGFTDTQTEKLLDAYRDSFWTEKDFDNCKALGMNCLRLPFTYFNLLDKCLEVSDSWTNITDAHAENKWTLKDDAFKRLEWFVKEAAKRGIYTVLDMHGAPGSQNGDDHSGDIRGAALWNDDNNGEFYRSATVWLWKEVASHFNSEEFVAGYDLLNESSESDSHQFSDKKTWDLYDCIYKQVRSVDSAHIIILESVWGADNLPSLEEYGWENVMYEYHQYCWNNQNSPLVQAAAMRLLLETVKSKNFGVPVYIGEFTFFTESESWDKGLTVLNDAGVNYTTWTYKCISEYGTWGIYNLNGYSKVNISVDSYSDMLAKWRNQGTVNQSGYTAENSTVYNALKKALGN